MVLFDRFFIFLQYAAQLEDYKKAIKIFEEVATWEADHPTLKYAAKNHFFQALLCYLCTDVVSLLLSFKNSHFNQDY